MGSPSEDPVLRSVPAAEYWQRFDDLKIDIEDELFELTQLVNSKISFTELQAIKTSLQNLKDTIK